MRETPLLHAIRAAVVAERDVLVWRNNTGVAYGASGSGARGVRFGLGVGGADLVGVLLFAAELGPCHVGRFFGLEVKAPGRKPTRDQILWANAVRSVGGFVATVHSVDEARAAISRCRQGELR